MVDPQSNQIATAVAAASQVPVGTAAISPRRESWVEFKQSNPAATGVAAAISPRCKPWVMVADSNRSPGRGGSASWESLNVSIVQTIIRLDAWPELAKPNSRSRPNRCRPYWGWTFFRGGVSHGSRRGLIAVAPAGAVGGEAGELEERIANNVAKLLEASS